MKLNHYTTLPLTIAAVLLTGFGTGAARAGSGSIGLAVAHGSFQVDRAKVWGSSSLFDGSTVETAITASEIQINAGADVRLAADSRVRVYRSRMVLEEGFTEVRKAAAYKVEARSLSIAPQSPDAIARIKLLGERKVTVAALGGPVEVRNGSGALVARMGAGMSLDFEPQQTTGAAGSGQTGAQAGAQTGAGGSGASSGAAGSAGAQAGSGAAAGSGSAGATAAGGAAGASAAGGTAAAGAAGAAGAAAGAGIGVGTIVVISGVAVGATLGGLAATGSLPGQSQSSSSASR